MTNITNNLAYRSASKEDLPKLVQMLAEDPLGKKRENYSSPLPKEYLMAFDKILNDENNDIIICHDTFEIIGFFQITYIPNLSYMGKSRALIEGVRVNKKYREQGVGKELLKKAIELGKQNNCHLLQLTTDKTRSGAIAFYKSLGFTDSHEGMKLKL